VRDELAQQLYDSIQNENEVRVFEKWHASSIAECPRSHYFKRMGVPGQNFVGGGKMLRWKAGHLIEEVIRPHLLSVYKDLQSNQRLESTELDLTGEYDNYSEAEETIFEVKSVHDFAFKYKAKADTRFHLKDSKPYLNHELQNHCYVKLLQEKGKPVSSIIYVYITLDGRIATYKTPVQQDLLDNVDVRLRVLNAAWADQEPPECICNDSHPLWKSTMQWCNYRVKDDECCSLTLLESL